MLKFIVPMLILTGARKREVLDAKWQDFDFLRRIWRIPTPKSGKARHVPLSDGVISLLSAMPRDKKCEWAFANPDTGKPYVSIFWAWDSARTRADLADVRIHDLRHSTASFLVNAGRTLYEVQPTTHKSFFNVFFSWDTARTRAGLKDVRMHDLRHSFASFLVNAGCSLYEVQKILGYASESMTQRYSHLNQESFLRAAEHAGNVVSPLGLACSVRPELQPARFLAQ